MSAIPTGTPRTSSRTLRFPTIGAVPPGVARMPCRARAALPTDCGVIPRAAPDKRPTKPGSTMPAARDAWPTSEIDVTCSDSLPKPGPEILAAVIAAEGVTPIPAKFWPSEAPMPACEGREPREALKAAAISCGDMPVSSASKPVCPYASIPPNRDRLKPFAVSPDPTPPSWSTSLEIACKPVSSSSPPPPKLSLPIPCSPPAPMPPGDGAKNSGRPVAGFCVPAPPNARRISASSGLMCASNVSPWRPYCWSWRAWSARVIVRYSFRPIPAKLKPFVVIFPCVRSGPPHTNPTIKPRRALLHAAPRFPACPPIAIW